MQQVDTDTMDGKHIQKATRILVIVMLVLVGLSCFLFIRHQYASQQTPVNVSPALETRAAYHRILGETHTGLRLARLADFLEHSSDSRDIPSARTQHDVLQMHEQRAWAELSETIYSLTCTIDEKTKAKDTYIANWGTLVRRDKLKSLPLTPPKQIEVQSPPQDIGIVKTVRLAGAPKAKSRKKKTKKTRTNQPPKGRTVTARMRKVRKPTYPSRAERRGIGAVVVLNLTIDKRGRVIRTRTLDVTAERYRSDFIRAAKRAARRTRFYPKTIGREPVMTRNFKRTYRFAVEN